MYIEIWHQVLNWLADHGILISSLTSLILTILATKPSATYRQQLYSVISVLCLTIIFSIEFYLLQFCYWPFTIVPILAIITSILLLRSKNKQILKWYALLTFSIFSCGILFAIELAKVSMNTWGSGTIFTGVFMIVHILPLFHLLTLLYPANKVYGYLKMVTGLIAMIIIFVFRFHHGDYDGDTVTLIRRSLFLTCIILIIEGFIVIFNEHNYNLWSLLKRKIKSD